MQHTGRVTLTENIWGLKWTKLINSTMMLGTLGVLGLNACEATRPGVIDLLVKIGRESVAVGGGRTHNGLQWMVGLCFWLFGEARA